MAVDMFMKLTKIKGESTDKSHPDEIEVLGWSWGGSQEASAHSGTGSGTGKVTVHDLTFTHYLDKASTDLLKAMTTGEHLDEGYLTCRKAGGSGGKQVEYLKMKLEEVYISNIAWGGSGERPTENVSLNFRKFTFTYSAQDAKGAPQPGTPFTYDIAKAHEA